MRRIAALMLLAVPLALGTAHAETRTERHTYLGGPGDAAWVACPDPDCPAEYVGGAQFSLEGESIAAISIADAVSSPTAGYFQFDDGAEVAVTSGAFCGSVTKPVPAGAVTLSIYVSEAFALLDCGSADVGTMGTITVAFR